MLQLPIRLIGSHPFVVTPIWMGAAFACAAALGAAVLAVLGANTHGIAIALRATARFSFLLFWLAYAGGALKTLFGPAFAGLARRRRDFGLAFASGHLAHLGFVIWLYRIRVKEPIPETSAVIFSIGFAWIFVLVALSMRVVRQRMSGAMWRVLQTVGLEYIAYLFFSDFFRIGTTQPLAYVPFAAAIALGFALRIAALLTRLWAPGGSTARAHILLRIRAGRDS
jgi:hypothetical protein